MSLPMKKSQQSKKPKQNNFLNDFIQREMYLQNPPMTTDKFIVFCKKRGIQTTKEELEFFEREKLFFPIIRIDRPIGEEERIKFKKEDGKEYWRQASHGLQEGETEIERYSVKLYSRYDVFSYHKDLLLNWLEEGNLFDPAIRDFQSWDTFIGEELEYERQKIVSFYSSFQIYWLQKLKQLNSINFTHDKTEFTLGNCEIKTENGKVFLNAELELKIEISNREEMQLLGGKTYKSLEHKEALINRFKSWFDLKIKKEKLSKSYEEFSTILRFLLSVQSVYFPYARSGGGTIQITGHDKKWQEARRNFKLDDVLEKLNLKIKDIAEWYKIFSDEAQKILGIKRDDWIQLWKNIAWSEKNNLEGNIRLGVEYLQWAVMFKRIIEEHLQKEILDIDEMSKISGDDILKFKPEQTNQYGVSLRAIRNKRYSDKDKNYYHDRYKRLFYLANDFGLDYQPRVTVFVEGKTEETIFPEIFEQKFGNKPENLGIEFINFEGVDKLLSTAKTSEKLRSLLQELQKQEKQQILSKSKNTELNQTIKNLNNINIVISNWTSFLSYNLAKWQIIPFFISDNEGGIKHFLDAEKPIKYYNRTYNIPSSWKFLWGITNNNKPFQGKNFEMANFNDDEIARVLSEILGKKIQPSDVKTQRNAGRGINQVDEDVENHKIDIAKRLIENLFDEYKKPKNKSLLGRPIFKALDKIRSLAKLIYPPVDRKMELENKEYLEKELQKTP